ncbi:MAG TPA: acyl-CoA dehydrogenase family protein, partial [Methylomirabilota bacterium]|nr:acyl-CoA dehydrogenase family protein [Methylomirabilota bacterium]
MTTNSTLETAVPGRETLAAIVRELGPRFAARCAGHDADDTFVAENYAELRERRVFSAGVPAELGGGGASYRELCELLRTLAHYCPSTSLALAMHT